MSKHVFLLMAALAVGGLLSCAKQNSTVQRNSPTPPPGPLKVGKYGSACRGEGVGPIGYLVSDIGKWGVPNPSPTQLALLAKIRFYDHSKTLRFAFMERGPYVPQFIVYDNHDHPCAQSSVLNGTPIEYYQPQQTPYVFTGPEGGTPYPWGSSSP